MARHQPRVGGCLARALELLGRSELADHDRRGLQTYAGNRIQKRASTLQLRILLDVLFDLFFQILNLTFDFVEEAAVRSANRLIVGFIQAVLRPGFLLFKRLTGARKLLKPALRR
jgi:hypothetical protein